MAFDLFRGVRPLTRPGALRDAKAGVMLASMNIPQLLGYARIAGMPAVTGIYTGFLPLIAFALFGASRHLVVAADSATATIFASKLSTMASPSSAEYVALAGMTALLTAAILLLARIFKLGFLADFLSRTVLVGFLTGVGMQVGVAMLGDMLGIPFTSRRTVLQIKQIVLQFNAIHWQTLAISAFVVAAILIFKRLRPGWPVPLLAVVGGIAASARFDFAGHGIAITGPVEGGLPHLAFPAVGWFQMIDLLQVAASCFVIIVAQSAATSRAFAEKYGERVDEDRNLLGLAAANATAAFSGAFVVNGSPTQTAMGEQAGARSQFAQLVFAGVVVIVLLFLSNWLQYLPRCVLGAIVFTIAVGLVHIGQLIDIRGESRGEFRLAVATAVSVVVIGVENGILIAIALSLLRHVRHSYRPHTMVLMPNDEGRWMPVPAQAGQMTSPGLIVYRFGADLFYANDHFFIDDIRCLIDGAPMPVRWLVIDAAAITDVDYSAGRSVNELCESLRNSGIKVIFGRVNRYLRADMDRHGITPVVGAENLYTTLHEALAAVHPELDAHADA
ncbi:high affinity sulfate transporter 1 [Paraburkholderia eburnea]|uniref:High affinity sulfate transporter 1 n=1 Tax=Paraburkholderia eburnea TaxID=1189126 RepID=A0A2S4MFM2_9BURK|nr:SulP family inorganic anion transporter [Paraburkholderia eburnea]POR53534.1 high affinity sulfate transporter 1 [Paraburkholderia eburnea]PRZ25502.1 high affinity sulfate transporter 1 [Paraburkholderia eburnea]